MHGIGATVSVHSERIGVEMLAAVLSAVGTTPRYQRFPEPEAGAGETVVRVTAAALKPFDRWWAAGRHPAGPGTFPQVVGADGVGELPDGRRVAFLTPRPPHGGMAERTLVRDGIRSPTTSTT
jgi:NADPH:quinone reductase-like Zn-dependent oxidoreductase